MRGLFVFDSQRYYNFSNTVREWFGIVYNLLAVSMFQNVLKRLHFRQGSAPLHHSNKMVGTTRLSTTEFGEVSYEPGHLTIRIWPWRVFNQTASIQTCGFYWLFFYRIAQRQSIDRSIRDIRQGSLKNCWDNTKWWPVLIWVVKRVHIENLIL